MVIGHATLHHDRLDIFFGNIIPDGRIVDPMEGCFS